MVITRSLVTVPLVLICLASWAVGAEEEAAAPANEAAADAAPAEAAEPVAKPSPLNTISQLMQDRAYDKAIKAIDAELAEKPKNADYLLYLKGRAFHFAKQYDDAQLTFDQLSKEHPKSVWARRGQLAKGATLARRGDFRAAEEIYRTAAERLLSTDRKQELAAIYLDFAAAYFKPSDNDKQPDYQKALLFYQQALAVGPLPAERAEIELRVGECYQQLGQYDQAIAQYEAFIKANPKSELDIEARYRLGWCQLQAGRLAQARRVWEDFLDKYVGHASPRIAEASYQLSLTYGIPNPPTREDLSLGIAALESFVEKFPAHKLASEALLRIAQTYSSAGRHEDAVKGFERLLADERYQDREEIPEARYRLGETLVQQQKFTAAIAVWREYLVKHPTHFRWSSVQAAIVDAEYFIAAHAQNKKLYDEARKQYGEFLNKYPLDNRAAKIQLQLGNMLGQENNWDEAIAQWRRVVSKYPNTEVATTAQYRIGHTLEVELSKYEEALKEYEKLPNFQPAQTRKAQLTAKRMKIETERVFRTNEPARVRLQSRNIDAVTVRAYVIDLETYFRKMHLATGVEGLDISLIDPDNTFEYKVPAYEKYRESDVEIELPLPTAKEPGVLAVTVSSETLEATTLVIRSDLEMIVKSSREEVFAFAQNMRTGKPWANARLLISNGQQVIAEGKTGEDGVFQQSYEELKSAEDVRVFAIEAGNVASNVVGLNGVGISQGLTEKGYIYTDRPAYRPGQLVNVRGIVRSVAGDTYKIDAGRKFDLQVFDPRDRVLYQDEVTLNDYGSFHAHFQLPPGSVLGSYRLQLMEADKPKFNGTFEVHEYKLDTVQLTVDTPRKVYYRGEMIEGTISAKFYYGTPLAGREIRYQLADQEVHTATTDKDGQIKFKLPTRDFRETQTLGMTVTLAERNLTMAVNFILATQGFTLGMKTEREVFLAGESFETTITATDAEGKPIAQKLHLQVLEETRVDSRRGERLVSEEDVTSDEKTGIVRKTLKLAEGGRYMLRVTGTDRFQNPITGEHVVQISGDDDSVRLRILSEQHTYRVGDTAQVRVHWREAPALALVTFQGAKVLEYKLVSLKTGENTLEIPLTAKLAPNFELAVAVMTDARKVVKAALKEAAKPQAEGQDEASKEKVNLANVEEPERPVVRFHEATSPFTVERQLNIKLAIVPKGKNKKEPRPGEPVEVTVTTTDAQGNPVVAEVSLALIEQSLLERYSFAVGAIQDFFTGQRRRADVRMTSSVRFLYCAATRPINPRLLAEHERAELAQAEERYFDQLHLLKTVGRLGRDEKEEPAEKFTFDGARTTTEENYDGDGPVDVFVFEGVSPANGPQGIGGALPAKSSVMKTPTGQAMQSKIEQGVKEYNKLVDSHRYADADAIARRLREVAPEEPVVQQLWINSRQLMRMANNEKLKSDKEQAVWNELNNIEMSAIPGDSNTPMVFPNAAEWVAMTERRRKALRSREVATMQKNGVMLYYNMGDLDGKQAAVLAKQMHEAGAALLSGLGYQETGYWNPALTTDKKGEAKLSFDLPDRSTAWKLLAKGITLETLAGEAEETLIAKKDLFGELKLPLAFVDGDQAQVLATVHNQAFDKGEVTVTLKTTIAGKSVTETKKIEVTEKGLSEIVFPVDLKRPEGKAAPEANVAGPDITAEFELTVASGEASDVLVRSVPVQPYGMPVFSTASGASEADTSAWLELPKDMPVQSPTLQVLIGPTVEQSLLDVILAPAPWCQVESARYASGLETTTSDLMAALALQKLVGTTRQAFSPEVESLDARVRSSIGALISAQNDEGGWSWTGTLPVGQASTSNRYMSARVVWALALARKSGYHVPEDGWSKALNYLQTQITQTAENDYESKAVLLHALSVAGKGDFPLANRLHRSRPALSSAALVYLALAFAEIDRGPMAGELLQLLATKNLDEAAPKRLQADSSLPQNSAGAELRALYALALEQLEADSPKLKPLVEYLQTHRTGYRWSPDRATGPATLALCQWYARTKHDTEHYKLKVFVNDNLVKELDITPETRSEVLDVPNNLLGEGKQRVHFELTGRGRFAYQCIYGGFVAADKLVATTKDWVVERNYEPAPLEVEGREIPRGFGIVNGAINWFRNKLTQLPVGKRGLVQIDLYRQNVPNNTLDESLEYLVVTEPLPSGVTVIENSVQGGFERYEVSPGAITFYIGNRRHVHTIHYQVHGYLPGEYRAAPTVVRNAYRPEQLAITALHPLAVLPLGAKSADEYKLTPQELFELGKRDFEAGRMPGAVEHLSKLMADYTLAPDPYLQTVRMLFNAHLELGPPAKLVHYFEIIKEKAPQDEIPFDKILKVGAAYHEIGEYERSFLVFRATIEGSFFTESRVAGFLDEQGEHLKSVEVMQRILGEYPPEPFVASATYALSQQVYFLAAEAATDPILKDKKVTRVDLIRRAYGMLQNFLTLYPEDTAADQASFSAANALLDLKQFDAAIAACDRYVQRYPESQYLDSYWYTIGFCHFARGEHEQALEMCRKVADTERKDPATGRMVESTNKLQAIYILGQVYHSLGKAAEAIREYSRVKDQFVDAAQAIEYFQQREVKLPEVTTLKPDEKPELELSFRNIAQADVRVYRIDLLKFSLLKRDLSGITNINLAGIRPLHEESIKLGDGKDYRTRTRKLELPLKEEGAYLVVCRGDDLHTSGLVLVTPLKVEVQEETASGRVRTTVRNVTNDGYVANVHVKVIGSRNEDFVSGETDLRGVYVADGIQGHATIIARSGDGRYAFYRGTTDLGPPLAPAAQAEQQAAEANAPQSDASQQLLDGLQRGNGVIIEQQRQNLQNLYRNEERGVRAKAAK